MTTPLIRDIMRYMHDAGVDPVELHWFDASYALKHRTEVAQDPLLICRPPFEKCMVVWEGASTHHEHMQMFMVSVGTEPDEGIVLSAWRCVPDRPPVKSPLLVYAVSDNRILYGPADEDERIDEKEAQMILGFASAWLGSMSRTAQAYIPSVRPTFTNRRKIAAGKAPIYDWKTVVIEPVQAARPPQGGTHASPRLHDRRGHLRRLRSGKNVWVRACTVGDASKGAVFKDYQIAEVTT